MCEIEDTIEGVAATDCIGRYTPSYYVKPKMASLDHVLEQYIVRIVFNSLFVIWQKAFIDM
jgi:hypothetical protein